MTLKTKSQRFGLLVFGALAILFVDPEASAQKKDYKPGEKVEYRSSGYPEVWEEATFLKATPDGSQPIIRQKPTEFFKDGYERAASWTDLRPLGAKKSTVKGDVKPNAPAAAGGTTRTTKPSATGLMSQTDVLAFLRTNFGDKPFANPRREELKQELAEMIKARGLDFRYSTALKEFDRELGKYGMTSEVIFPLRDNYGAPTKQVWLMGAWNLSKIGAAVDYVKDGRVYRQGEIGVANVGTLTLQTDGGYVWKADAKTSTRGRWRKATRLEMKSQGGDGIVLLKAKGSYDWLVTKNRNTTLPGEWINISELATRQINEHGSRGGKR